EWHEWTFNTNGANGTNGTNGRLTRMAQMARITWRWLMGIIFVDGLSVLRIAIKQAHGPEFQTK
ncbi:MAG: hypothetical protein ACUVRJ_06045, partial [Candidatus Villigracilaceae bacterium]